MLVMRYYSAGDALQCWRCPTMLAMPYDARDGRRAKVREKKENQWNLSDTRDICLHESILECLTSAFTTWLQGKDGPMRNNFELIKRDPCSKK